MKHRCGRGFRRAGKGAEGLKLSHHAALPARDMDNFIIITIYERKRLTQLTNNGRINIPFFIDEDDDYEVKLEDIVECYGDGYDVRVGDPYNNFSIEWKDITDTYLLHDDVLSVELNSFNETMIISEQGSNHLYDVDNMLSLIRLYETLYRLTH
jgi:hypothetical protein